MQPHFQNELVTLYQADCRAALGSLEEESVACCVTSPPYWGLRDYDVEGQIGLEETLEGYVGAHGGRLPRSSSAYCDEMGCFG